MAQDSVIQDRTRHRFARGAIIVGIVLGVCGAGCAVGRWTGELTAISRGQAVLIVSLILGIGGLSALIGGLTLHRIGQIGVPTLVVPPLRLGGVAVARFQQQGTKRIFATWEVEAELEGSEHVSYQQGSTVSRATRTIYHCALTVKPDDTARGVSARIDIDVPLDAPPSLSLNHNRIQWWVRVRVRCPSVFFDQSKFLVTVLPVVADQTPRGVA
jgi:hypothetical protein